jgi:hypothetical protein
MENILLVIDGTNFDMNTVDFACYVAKLAHSRLTAVFIENMMEEERPVLKQLHGLPYVETISTNDLPENKERIRSFKEYEKHFSEACVNRGVNYHFHRDRRGFVKDIVVESRFADLIIINPETSFEKRQEGTPSHFVKNILGDAECPVIIAPFSFDGIDEILFTYDGSKSSVFAIKQFAHLFPELKDKKITVLQINEKGILPFKENDKLVELLKSHYSHIGFQHLQGNPSNELFSFLLGKKNIFVVIGAYGRTMLSSLLRESTAELVIKTINLPFFIAHS